jgi:hypothetical protein
MTTDVVWEDPNRWEPPRDNWKRPLIIRPDREKRVAYTRCTTYVDCLEDRFKLSQWERRMDAVGLARRPDLVLRVASLGEQPSRAQLDNRRVWDSRMNEICDQAKEAAQASARATIGTSLHALAETIDRGLDPGPVPEQYRPHLDLYREKTQDFTALHIERFTVQDDLWVGGTPDRIVKTGNGRAIIADIKTGEFTFGQSKAAMQLAVYAHSQFYDPQTGQRSPLPEVDLEHGLIIALNAETGTCELLDIDIAAGWEAVQLATQVRQWRARRNLTQPWQGAYSLTEQLDLSIRQATAGKVRALNPDTSLVKAIQQASTQAELVALWRAAGDRWLPRHTELAAARKQALAGQP